ncbi:hypothetical protein [Micromonospora sp. CPCC 206061]|uniref:hypothetical protein n=1 Tax=Micromonospora sp. CPCC 206061 TaxID=3122410 RepID=UPI002FF0CC65
MTGPGGYDPDAEHVGDGLYGRLLAAGSRSDLLDPRLTRLLDRPAKAMVDLAARRAGAMGRLRTGTDDLMWAACHTERAVAILRHCGLDTAEVLRDLASVGATPARVAGRRSLTRGLCRVVMVADYLAHQSGAARAGVAHLTTALLVEGCTRAYRMIADRDGAV